MVFYNSSSEIGLLIDGATFNITGDLFLTLLALLIVVLAFFLMFRIPMIYSAVLILPLMIVMMAYTSQFLAIGGLFLIYLAILIGNYWLTRD